MVLKTLKREILKGRGADGFRIDDESSVNYILKEMANFDLM